MNRPIPISEVPTIGEKRLALAVQAARATNVPVATVAAYMFPDRPEVATQITAAFDSDPQHAATLSAFVQVAPAIPAVPGRFEDIVHLYQTSMGKQVDETPYPVSAVARSLATRVVRRLIEQ